MRLLESTWGRRLLFGVLYLSEGAPIGYLWEAFAWRMGEAGFAAHDFARLASLLALPWALKFLWAPIVDTLRSPRFTLRGWILLCQTLMGLLLVPLLFLDLGTDYALVMAVLVAHAFVASTQDVAIDALAVATVPPQERGSVNAWMTTGKWCGRMMLGAGGIAVSRGLGDDSVVILLVAVIWGTAAALLLGVDPKRLPAALEGAGGLRKRFLSDLRRAARGGRIWLGLLYALTAGAAFEAVGALRVPLLRDQGVPAQTISWVIGIPTVAAIIAGALAAGFAADRMGRVAVNAALVLATAGCVALIASFVLTGGATGPFLSAMVLLYFLIGALTTSQYALFMDLTRPGLIATQFALFTGASNLCESWAARAVAELQAAWGYGRALLAMAAISLASLVFLGLLRLSGDVLPWRENGRRERQAGP